MNILIGVAICRQRDNKELRHCTLIEFGLILAPQDHCHSLATHGRKLSGAKYIRFGHKVYCIEANSQSFSFSRACIQWL